ncbi:ornithine carbamoyltransferase [Rathayibacter toxicus]|uniref:Ornithine carbamoyltransferase n=1 Tax=Rathayibacter toxicus TaxID=145458 RepID=A0A2S5Y8U7_9MICO|nr:ornithine carbamoyltransferase [Rathayibacter toxicus]ALS56961.1 ornithine carbamoyltransferase [Rathayibacter toxicus]PPG23165.1 ornithine carbamoyltransferase [Rathayibacter toxicus]PPG47748.1 ornithine carbamoyltransferase [Rathayibacter toxicus]PPH24891.1 ornithine carbamoyltransferase [Rathayibacter toxicus]PPH58816.1 ornithine carbamoyltransferase [Rathayibacter toxicus]
MINVVNLRELGPERAREIVQLGLKLKREPSELAGRLAGKGLLMIFEKPSTRTALSFQAAMGRMGGYSVVLDWDKSNFAISPIETEARYASSNTDIIVARLKRHSDLLVLASSSIVPVINGCDDRFHPTQALADFLTILETSGHLGGQTLCYVGVLNNVANSLIEGAMLFGVNLRLVTPIINEPSFDEELMSEALASGLVTSHESLHEGLQGAGYVYTDTWIDMENYHSPEYQVERENRLAVMRPFSLTSESLGDRPLYIMHDMPIHPGFEITMELVNHARSVIYRQAENRMHVEQALLLELIH